MNLFCLTVTKRKKKEPEPSFNFIRLHPKQHIEPLVTPPSTPLTFPPPPPIKRRPLPAPQPDSVPSKFTERLELPPSFYETAAFSESTRDLIPKPLNLQSGKGAGEESSASWRDDGMGDGWGEQGHVHPYLRTLVYGVVGSAYRGDCGGEEVGRKGLDGKR